MIFNTPVLFPVIISIKRRGGILKPKGTEMLAPCDVNTIMDPCKSKAKNNEVFS